MKPLLEPFESAAPAPPLRVLEGRRASLVSAASALRAWILLFGSLCAAGGQGVFLACALTRLEKIPGRAELGGPLEITVIAWFVAAAPLALLSALLRARLTALGSRAAWALAAGTTLVTAAAFAIYLRAIALA